MQFRDLGPLEVVADGQVLDLGSGRQVALVGALLVRANEVVSVDRLVDDLWRGSAPPTAPKIVRNSVSMLRRELGDRLVTRSPGYMLRVEAGELDSERLEQAVASGDLDELTDALALWRGPPLSQLAYEPFAEYEIARLEELHRTAVEARIDVELERGRHASVIPELESLVREHPLRERLTGQLMLALYRSGRQADALEVYRQARERLGRELGIEPGPALKELERKILNQDESLAGPAPEAPEKPTGRRRGLLLVVGAAAVLLAAAALAAVLATRESSAGLKEVHPNHVGIIDPKTNRIVAEIQVGIDPGPISARGGWVWVGNLSLSDRNMTKIDVRSRMTVATVSLDDRTPTGLAVDRQAVWVAHGHLGEVSRVDARFRQITDTLPVTPPAYAAPTGAVAVGLGKVWAVFGNSTLARIERSAAPHVSGRTRTGSEPAAVVVGGGAVWVANSGDATVQRFDPVTFEEGPLGKSFTVGKRPVGIAYGDGAVWVADQGDDTVTRIDQATESTRTIEVGADPVAIAFGEGAVWVANSGDGTVSRIDPDENRVVRTIEVGNAPSGVTVADGSVWLTSQTP